ncbi:MAG: type II toxin-antitoxin system RelE/ParE family toxin [Oscillospiraceae bacterium]|jgi:phage-related protein|nr:type II toxin-antitoxin system RelE/ParE family toxin [Oscillospiraceae bacterium]
MQNYDIQFFETSEGKCPVRDFMDSLDMKMLAKLYRTLEMVEEFGSALREPYSKHLDDGIFELRAKVGSDITRVLYFFFIGHKVILTNGFIKKTQKTPQGEINKAKEYRKEYLIREEQSQ